MSFEEFCGGPFWVMIASSVEKVPARDQENPVSSMIHLVEFGNRTSMDFQQPPALSYQVRQANITYTAIVRRDIMFANRGLDLRHASQD